MDDIFKGKTKREISTMDSGAIERFIAIQLCELGIPILGPPPTETRAEYIEKSEVGWHVGPLIFTDRAAADAVACELRRHAGKLASTKYDYKVGYSVEWLEPREDVDFLVEEKRYYNAAAIQANLNVLTKIKNAKDTYEEDKKSFDKIAEKRARIADAIWAERWEAVRFIERVDRLKSSYPEYRKIATTEEQARAFFIKAWESHADPDVFATACFELGFESVVAKEVPA
jgi:hypothetical protein